MPLNKYSGKRVYIAGPYSGDEEKNVDKAMQYWVAIAGAGFYPYLPHLYHHVDKVYKYDYEFWMEQDQAMLDSCDILFRMPGLSAGADREVAYAEANKIKVISTLDELYAIGMHKCHCLHCQ